MKNILSFSVFALIFNLSQDKVLAVKILSFDENKDKVQDDSKQDTKLPFKIDNSDSKICITEPKISLKID